MPRVYIIPHHAEEQLFSEVAAIANASQSDFRFHILPSEFRDDSPLMSSNSDFRHLLEHLESRKRSLGAADDDLIVAFYHGLLSAAEAGLTNLFVAGARYDEPTPCTAVVSMRFLSSKVLEKRFDYLLQKHAVLHLLVCCILGAYTHVDAHAATFGCLYDFDGNLSDFNRKLSRGYYLCSPQENDCCRAVLAERYGNAILQLCSVLKYRIDQKSIQISIGEFIMGDLFKNIRDSTIVNRSKIVNALNTIENHIDDATKNAVIEVANLVSESRNVAAGTLLDHFNDELAKPQRDKGKLKQLWVGLVNVLPDVAKLGDAVAKIAPLFS